MGWLERYQSGDRERVWHELRQLGDRVRDPESAAEAQAVCDEMARRARQNVEVVVDRLAAQGYRFHTNDDKRAPVIPLRPPTANATATAAWLEDRFGPLPMTMSSWLRLVGDVWLVGSHPVWNDIDQADPLVVELEYSGYPDASAKAFYEGEFEAWQEWASEDPGAAGGFVLPVAPDRLHKANTSGGPPYGFRVPDACAEGTFVGEVAMPFVAYLNWVFASGGFPGPSRSDAQWRVRRDLAKDLLPL